MSRIFCVLTLFLCLFPSVAAGKDKVSFFAKVKCDRPVVNRGDSCLVSVILYGTSPFFYMDEAPLLTVRNAKVRKLNVRRELTVRKIVEGGRVYYIQVGAQYVITPLMAETLEIPSVKFKGKFRIYDRLPGPFDSFYGVRSSFREREAKAVSTKIKIPVREKPLRSTQEAFRSGLSVF